jgi:dihydrofolate reductase
VRNVYMWNLMSLDGYFESKPWGLDFHEQAWGEELERFGLDQMATADTLLFGRATYEGMASYWPTSTEQPTADRMNEIAKIVFSRTLDRVTWNNTRLVRGPAEEEVARLKQQEGGDMLIFGSAELSASLMRAGLIDEFRLCLVPIVLGGGTPLFKPLPEPVNMTLVESHPLKTGGVILKYRPAEPD